MSDARHILGQSAATVVAAIVLLFVFAAAGHAGHSEHNHGPHVQTASPASMTAPKRSHTHLRTANSHHTTPTRTATLCPMTLSQSHCEMCFDLFAVNVMASGPRKFLTAVFFKADHAFWRQANRISRHSSQENRVRGPPSRIAPRICRIVALR